MRMKLYLAVTPDKYELPIAVADNVVDLAKMLGKSPYTIYTAIRRNRLRGNKPVDGAKFGGERFYEVDYYERTYEPRRV